MQLVVLIIRSPFKVYCIFICRIISITVLIQIIDYLCKYVQHSNIFSLPNKVAIEKVSTSSEISLKELIISWEYPFSSLFMTQKTWITGGGGGLGHMCAHICQTMPGEPPEDGEMNKVTLPSRHRILNSEAEHAFSRSHNIKSLQDSEEVTFCFFETWMPAGGRTRDLWFSKQAALTTAPGPPPCSWPIDSCL